MRAGKGIIDVNIAKLCQFGNKGRIILFFCRVIAKVFQNRDFAVLKAVHHVCRRYTNAVIGKFHRTTKLFGKSISNRLKRHFGNAFALGAAKMGNHNQFRTGICQFDQPRNRAFDAGGIAHNAIFHRNVKISAQQNALASDIDTVKRIEVSHYLNLLLSLTKDGRGRPDMG